MMSWPISMAPSQGKTGVRVGDMVRRVRGGGRRRGRRGRCRVGDPGLGGLGVGLGTGLGVGVGTGL